MNEHLQDLLNRSLHGELSGPEQKQLTEALKNDPGLRQEQQHLQELSTLLKDQSHSFAPGFADRVMDRIDGGKASKIVPIHNSQKWGRAFLKVALSGAAAVLIFILGVYFTEGALSLDILMGTESINGEHWTTYMLYDV